MPRIIGTPKVRFNLFNWNEEETYIMVYFVFRPKRMLKFSTGRKISPNNWDRVKMRAVHSRTFPESSYINSRLELIERECLNVYHDTNRGRISVEEFKQRLFPLINEDDDFEEEQESKPLTFLQFVEEAYQERANDPAMKPGSLQVVHKLLVHLKNYSSEKRRKLEFSELNERFYSDFKAWLHKAPRNHSTNYVKKTWANLKYFIRKAENRHFHNDRSYREFQIKSTPTTKIVLSFEQLEHLAALNFTDAPHLDRARDLFLISAYSGARFSDYMKFKPEMIKSHQGETILEMVAQKTNQLVFIPLLPVLDRVLSKYNYTAPKISNQKLNKSLKEVGKLAGLTQQILDVRYPGGVRVEKTVFTWELLTTHVGRRSFATNFYQKFPHLIDSIMKVTGHTTEAMFRKYIVIDAKDSAVKFGRAVSE
ncbi:MAG: phage integrase SAM-like domain-containing protein [Saprospiraceae bacterium]|nr:phage integrase SAM-like domain-containing protein [Saprospiraceae bacterium]